MSGGSLALATTANADSTTGSTPAVASSTTPEPAQPGPARPTPSVAATPGPARPTPVTSAPATPGPTRPTPARATAVPTSWTDTCTGLVLELSNTSARPRQDTVSGPGMAKAHLPHQRPVSCTMAGGHAQPPTAVGGVSYDRAPAAAQLAQTGSDLALLVTAGLALLLAGVVLTLVDRRLRRV